MVWFSAWPAYPRWEGAVPGGGSVLLAEKGMVAHADGLQMLAQHLVEVVGHLLGGPATVAPHGGDLPGRLEQGVGEPGAPQHLPVDVGGALGGQEGDQGCVEGGVLVGRWLRALVQVLSHAGDP